MSKQVVTDKRIHAIEQSLYKVKFCEQFDEKSHHWNLDRHNHDVIEIIYFLDGNADVVVSEERMHMSLYNMIVYPKSSYHQEQLDPSRHQEIICIMFESSDFEFDHSMTIPDTKGELQWLFRKILEEHKAEVPSETLITHYLKTLCIHILRLDAQKDQKGIGLVVHYIQEHFAEPLTNKQLADLIYVSESYLIRRFKEVMNRTPNRYINDLRIEASKRLLSTTDMTIEEISNRVGCNSPKYFSRLFKKIVSMTPRNFRDNC